MYECVFRKQHKTFSEKLQYIHNRRRNECVSFGMVHIFRFALPQNFQLFFDFLLFGRDRARHGNGGIAVENSKIREKDLKPHACELKKTQRNEWLCSAKMCVKGRNRIIRERARTQHREKERVRFVRITMNSVMFAFCCTQLFHIPLKKYRRGFMHRTTHAHNLPFSSEHANFQRTYFCCCFLDVIL